MTANDFVIKRTCKGDYIVHVKDRDAHSHFKRRSGCLKLIELICKNRLPTRGYWITAARRVLYDDEFMMLEDKRKPMYVNVNKGVIK